MQITVIVERQHYRAIATQDKRIQHTKRGRTPDEAAAYCRDWAHLNGVPSVTVLSEPPPWLARCLGMGE